MSRSKPITLKEAREKAQLDRFAEEHPSKGNEKKFDKLLNAMAKPAKKKPASS